MALHRGRPPRSCRARRRSFIEVDAHGQEVCAHDAHEGAIDTFADCLEPSPRVVIREYFRGSRPPAATDLDPDVRVGEDVLDVARVATVFGDDPERAPVA